jgi:hypothetical protein
MSEYYVLKKYKAVKYQMEHAVVHLVEALLYKLGESRVRFLVWSLGYFIDLILAASLWPWVRLGL